MQGLPCPAARLKKVTPGRGPGKGSGRGTAGVWRGWSGSGVSLQILTFRPLPIKPHVIIIGKR